MKKVTIISIIIISLSICGVIFIYFANDHSECDNKIETSFGENGEKIIKEKHICKEKYNI